MINEGEIALLKSLSESFGPAGFEIECAKIFKNYAEGYADEIITDKLGSVAFKMKGESDLLKILVAGHIDEVGFVISGIHDETGFLTFAPLGGWWDHVLLSQRVIVRTEKGDLHGIIAAKPPHILKDDERKKLMEKRDMFIDIGASSDKEAREMGVKIGDPVVPYSPFSLIKNGSIAMGKAFDDRIGAFVSLLVAKELKTKNLSYPNTYFGAATVQEEVGLRGAMTISHIVEPDVAIVIEVDIAGDIPDVEPFEAPSKLGKGPSIITYDASMIPNQNLKRFVIKTAEENKIPYQLSMMARGGTDAGRIHTGRAGCPSIVIGVPTRHIHSHVGLLSLSDTENTVKLVVELIKKMDKEVVESFTRI